MVDPAAVDYSIPGYDNPDGSERGRIRVPTYSAWTMEAGSDTVEVPLVNTEGNPCYMKFAVKLKDSGEVLYESELVPPGKAVPEIRLNRPLEAGTTRRGGDIDLQPGRSYPAPQRSPDGNRDHGIVGRPGSPFSSHVPP